MKYIEIQTVEGGRLEWIAIYGSTNDSDLGRWGHALLQGVTPKPYLRVTDGLRGPVIGAWQEDGYEETNHG